MDQHELVTKRDFQSTFQVQTKFPTFDGRGPLPSLHIWICWLVFTFTSYSLFVDEFFMSRLWLVFDFYSFLPNAQYFHFIYVSHIHSIGICFLNETIKYEYLQLRAVMPWYKLNCMTKRDYTSISTFNMNFNSDILQFSITNATDKLLQYIFSHRIRAY